MAEVRKGNEFDPGAPSANDHFPFWSVGLGKFLHIKWGGMVQALNTALGDLFEAKGVAAQLLQGLRGGVEVDGDTLAKLRALISTLQTVSEAEQTKVAQLQAAIASDDLTLDTVQELVTYIKANKNLIDSVTTNKLDKSVYEAFLIQYANDLAGKQGKLPAPTSPGQALTSDASLGLVWAALIATAGGSVEGALQTRGVDGKVTGTDLLLWNQALRQFVLGSVDLPALMRVYGNASAKWTIQDGLPWEVVINDNMPNSITFRTKSGTVLFQIDTTSNNEKTITLQSSELNGGIYAPVRERQVYVDTASTAKAFAGRDTHAGVFEVVNFPVANAGNWIKAECWIVAGDDQGEVGVDIHLSQTWQRGAAGIHRVDSRVAEVHTYGAAGAPSATFEVSGDGTGIVLAITPGVATALKWKVYCPNMKY
ncbi:hypothetical protein [Rufibacter quisquiliarum]|uniref:Uncharacterized protein n=1 Tax=Rufibacter quisquiliarum TaxID=1549639 RepID=A0A839GJ98_9BACT|nr:hypothetical protein [Rufibacter quisquiliarum]MBA9078932.1 hypothetical protein [Rufibacter quisquiliarum]